MEHTMYSCVDSVARDTAVFYQTACVLVCMNAYPSVCVCVWLKKCTHGESSLDTLRKRQVVFSPLSNLKFFYAKLLYIYKHTSILQCSCGNVLIQCGLSQCLNLSIFY